MKQELGFEPFNRRFEMSITFQFSQQLDLLTDLH